VAIAAARLSVGVMVLTYLAVTIIAAIRHEEAGMRARFGDQYDAYLQSRAQPVERTFTLERAIRNKEHRAIAGLAIMAAVLGIKAVFRM
jgi:hypothetical protein